VLRQLIGVRITDTVLPWWYEVTRDSIRHNAHGIGDDNALWCDPDYAARTKYGGLVAPPSFVFALNRILSGYVGGLPGVHAMWSGADITWHSPLLLCARIHCEADLKDLVERQTQFAGRCIQQIYHVDLFDQDDNHLVAADSWCFRTERDTAREQGTKYENSRTSLRRTARRTSSGSSPGMKRRQCVAPSRATLKTSPSVMGCPPW